MVYDHVFERLTSLRGQSVELGLAQVTRLLDQLDHPERDFPAVHVAGTNGKGSICAMVAAMLQGAGLRVGLLTSPHLVNYSERIRVNGRAISAEAAGEILDDLERDDGSFDGSFFEVTTAVAFEHFRRRGVDVAVLETGLGGRLDATNVCHPRVTCISRIDLDHTKTLGSDRATIAGEKAGIIKPGIPVVIGAMAEEASVVLEAVADRRGAPVHRADEVEVRALNSSWGGYELSIRLPGEVHHYAELPLPGHHQLENVATAALAASAFVSGEVEPEALLAGLSDTNWPGRLTRVAGNPVRVYDVAHNPSGACALAEALRSLGLPDGSVLVAGMLSDKNAHEMVEPLAPFFRRAVALTPNHPTRARPADETAAALRSVGFEAEAVADPGSAIDRARQVVEDDGWIVVTGSLFTVGAAMQAFGDPVDVMSANKTKYSG